MRRRRPDQARDEGVRVGLRANLGQFLLLVAVNGLVGAMLGQERAVLPLLARGSFGLRSYAVALSFIASFGTAKAATNLVAGTLADRVGRRPVLIAGWLAGIPLPLLLMWAPSWGWIVLGNALLGVNQGLSWSATVIMKVDLVGPGRRGLAMGLNEAMGYLAVAGSAAATGLIAERAGLRPAPFLLGLAVAGSGLILSALAVRETRDHAAAEASGAGTRDDGALPWHAILARVTFRDPVLAACAQAGMVSNLNDAVAWGILPIVFAGGGLGPGAVGILVATYPAVWGASQPLTGALSDRVGRRGPIVAGMSVQAVAFLLLAVLDGFAARLPAMALLGLGTGLVYPTLLAAVGDVAHPAWRATALGVYRSWRDAGFAAGAVTGGLVADALGPGAAIVATALLTAASGALVAVRFREAPG